MRTAIREHKAAIVGLLAPTPPWSMSPLLEHAAAITPFMHVTLVTSDDHDADLDHLRAIMAPCALRPAAIEWCCGSAIAATRFAPSGASQLPEAGRDSMRVRPVAEGALGPLLVVFAPPAGDQHLRFRECGAVRLTAPPRQPTRVALRAVVATAAPATLATFALGQTVPAPSPWPRATTPIPGDRRPLSRGVAPIPASSGKTDRHRGGDRDPNRALHTALLVRMRYCPRTRAYVEPRTREGQSKREIMRCLKRCLAREVQWDCARRAAT